MSVKRAVRGWEGERVREWESEQQRERGASGVPDALPVVGGDEQVVAGGVHGHVADPLRARQQLAHQLLLHQVVHAHHALGLTNNTSFNNSTGDRTLPTMIKWYDDKKIFNRRIGKL